jgi:hypothetical protein
MKFVDHKKNDRKWCTISLHTFVRFMGIRHFCYFCTFSSCLPQKFGFFLLKFWNLFWENVLLIDLNITIEIIKKIIKKSSKHLKKIFFFFQTSKNNDRHFSIVYVVSFHIHHVNINKQLNIGSRTCGRDVA